MGQLLSIAYKLIATPVPLPQKIRDQINFFLLYCPSESLVKSLLEMSINTSIPLLKRLPEKLERSVGREIILDVYFGGIKEDLQSCIAAKQSLFENLTAHRHAIYSSVTDEHIKTLKSDIEVYILESFAKTYIFAITALKALDPNNTEWKAELEAIIDTPESCLDDLQRYHGMYQEELIDFNDKYKNNLELIATVKALTDYLETVLPKPAVHSARYRE